MEYGPRALGSRSILGDARNPEMQKKMNLKIKYREGFRPFAPTVLEEDIQEYFDVDRPSPYMLLVVPMREDKKKTGSRRLQRMEPCTTVCISCDPTCRRSRTWTIRRESRASVET